MKCFIGNIVKYSLYIASTSLLLYHYKSAHNNLATLFLYNEKTKKAIIAELTVPFEPNIPKAHEIKQSRYAGLLSDLNRAGVNTSLVCFEIGSRGLITQDNVARIRSILKFKGVSFKKKISRDISKLALLGSYAIWNSRKEAIWDNISCLKINGA